MKNKYLAIFAAIGICSSSVVLAKSSVEIGVEERRIAVAEGIMPSVLSQFDQRVDDFSRQIKHGQNFTALMQMVIKHGSGLWLDALAGYKNKVDYDDRPLYWARLQMRNALKNAPFFKTLYIEQKKDLLAQFELISRGGKNLSFDKNTDKRIIITGFDPFQLDSNIKQSNPSGVAALALNDTVFSIEGVSAEIETLILPVRFSDFDQGIVEKLLTPYFEKNGVDMVITLSMGRENFDIERYAGLRRSAESPDNTRQYSGGSETKPIIPKLGKNSLVGPEFLELSLPVEELIIVQDPFPVYDNTWVTTLEGPIEVKREADLLGATSVEGSGGGYLSNEVAYRALLLRDQYRPLLPVGHIHTPSISGYQPKASAEIVKQLKAMLAKGVRALP